MRNTLAYDLSGAMGMNQMSTVWVDVVMNGEYVGNYQFCEQVRVDEERVDIFDWEGFAEDSAEIIAEVEGLEEDDLADFMLENMEWITSGQIEFEGNTYQVADYKDIEIPVEKLTAESGKMNVIEVKINDNLSKTIARNFVTVK